MHRYTLVLLGALALGASSEPSAAHDHRGEADGGNVACPVASPYPGSYDDTFGAGTTERLHCNRQRANVKYVVQINDMCRDRHFAGSPQPINNVNECYANDMAADGKANRAYAIFNLLKMVEDLKITHGVENYRMVAVVHDSGWQLIRKGNPYEAVVKKLMGPDYNVKFYFCLNTAASLIDQGTLQVPIADQLIEGVEYVPAGLSAISDLQVQGYALSQP